MKYRYLFAFSIALMMMFMLPMATMSKASDKNDFLQWLPKDYRQTCMWYLSYEDNQNLRLVCNQLKKEQEEFQVNIDNTVLPIPNFALASYKALRGYFDEPTRSIFSIETELKSCLENNIIDRNYLNNSVIHLCAYLNNPLDQSRNYITELEGAQSPVLYLNEGFHLLGHARACKLVCRIADMIEIPHEDQTKLLDSILQILHEFPFRIVNAPFLFRLTEAAFAHDWTQCSEIVDIQGQLSAAKPTYYLEYGFHGVFAQKKTFNAMGITLEDLCKYHLDANCPIDIDLNIIHMCQYLMTGHIAEAQKLWEQDPALCHDGPLAVVSAHALKRLNLKPSVYNVYADFSKAALCRLLKMEPMRYAHMQYFFSCLKDMNYPEDMMPQVDQLIFDQNNEVISSYDELDEDWMHGPIQFYLNVNQPIIAQKFLNYALQVVQNLDQEEYNLDSNFWLQKVWPPLIKYCSLLAPEHAQGLLKQRFLKESASVKELSYGIRTSMLINSSVEAQDVLQLLNHPQLLTSIPTKIGPDLHDSFHTFDACSVLYMVDGYQGLAIDLMMSAFKNVKGLNEDWDVHDLFSYLSVHTLTFFNPVHVLNETVSKDTILSYFDQKVMKFQKEKKECLLLKTKISQQ